MDCRWCGLPYHLVAETVINVYGLTTVACGRPSCAARARRFLELEAKDRLVVVLDRLHGGVRGDEHFERFTTLAREGRDLLWKKPEKSS